jgi:hypothetical protein
MRQSYLALSVSMLLSFSALGGCAQNPNLGTPIASATPSSTPSVSEAAKAKAAMSSTTATLTPVGVKTIKPDPALKPGKKLTPKEVDDLIRKLSVCRPI